MTERARIPDELVREVWRQNVPAIRRLLASGADPNMAGGE